MQEFQVLNDGSTTQLLDKSCQSTSQAQSSGYHQQKSLGFFCKRCIWEPECSALIINFSLAQKGPLEVLELSLHKTICEGWIKAFAEDE